MMTLRDLIEKEVLAIGRQLSEKPKMFSEYGKAYWKGNIEALNWVLEKIGEVSQSSTQTARKDEKNG